MDATTQPSADPLAQLTINTISADAPWRWLAAGWADMWRSPVLSLGYGIGFTVISVLIVFGLMSVDAASLAIAGAGGFMLLGPMLAVGLYELSRRYESGLPIQPGAVILVATQSPTQLAYLGILLMGVLLIWIRIAMLLFALFQGSQGFPPLDVFFTSLFTTDWGISLLIIGSGTGAVLAMAVFAISAISVPLLLEKPYDVVTATIASVTAVRRNLGPMLLWAALVAVFSAVGLVTLFIGLAIIFPLLGHATWHAYRDLVSHHQ